MQSQSMSNQQTKVYPTFFTQKGRAILRLFRKNYGIIYKMCYTIRKEDMFVMKNIKYGFSFAEVMITLVIIGVVSMLVVPALLDNTTQRINNTAASKADLEVHQAALRVQGECIRWRCIDTTVNPEVHVYTMLANYLRNNGEHLQYKIENDDVTEATGIRVLVNVENADATNLAYKLLPDGSVTVACSLDNYKRGTACNADGYSWEDGASWLNGQAAQ